MTTFYNNGLQAKAKNPMYRTGKKLTTVHSQLTVDASELTNGDIFVLAGGLPLDARVHRIFSPNATPALTAATDNDIGFYKMVDGALVALDKDIVVDGATLASALSTRDLLSLNSSLDRSKTIGELLSLTNEKEPASGVYLCLTMNTKSTADGVLDLDIVVEYPTM